MDTWDESVTGAWARTLQGRQRRCPAAVSAGPSAAAAHLCPGGSTCLPAFYTLRALSVPSTPADTNVLTVHIHLPFRLHRSFGRCSSSVSWWLQVFSRCSLSMPRWNHMTARVLHPDSAAHGKWTCRKGAQWLDSIHDSVGPCTARLCGCKASLSPARLPL